LRYCSKNIVNPGIALSLVLPLIFTTNLFAAPKDPLPTSGEFDQVQTITSPRLTVKSVDHVTFKGKRYTMQSVDAQSFEPYTDLADGQSYYHFVPAANEAMRLIINSKQQGALDELKQQTTDKIQGMTKTGSLTYDGYACDSYAKDLGDGAKVTMVLSTNPEFPFIVKTTLTVPSKSLTQINEIANIKLNSPVDDSVFVLPKGTKIVDQPTNPANNQAPTGSPTPQQNAPNTTSTGQ